MRHVAQPAFHAEGIWSLAEYRLLVAYRLDLPYLAKPAPGEFALLDPARRTKTFYAIPRGLGASLLRLLVEECFSPSERVDEFEWVL